MSTLLRLPLAAALLFAVACSDSAETAPATTEEAPPAATSPAPPAPGSDGGLAPVTSRTPAPSGSLIEAPGAVFDLPEGWQSETPNSNMRLAQASIPGNEGLGQLTVFYFGPGGGGPVDANLDRWLGQVEVDAGTTPTRDTFNSGAFRGTWVEVVGTIKPSTMGVGPTTPQPDSRMLAAVVEGPQGPWFFKATGPASTLEAERDAFLGMLRSVRTP